MKSFKSLFTLLAILPILIGCAKSATPTTMPTVAPHALPSPTPTAPPPPTPTEGASDTTQLRYPILESQQTAFAAYQPEPVNVKASVPPYEIDLEAVVNPDLIQQLSPQQQALLAANGFVVLPWGPEQIYQVYKAAQDSGAPILVTTDALLHSHHVLYDYALRLAELEHFVADLTALNAAMLAAAQEQYAGASATVQEAARRNVAFFAVASVLLQPETPVPPQVEELVEAELALIEAHAGFAQSPIFDFKEDYSQYVPRGHYTRNETFERYFCSMMWYGRIGFRLKPGETPEEIQMGRRETRQAILISAALSGETIDGQSALAVWERIYEPTVFFVGQADDLTVYDYLTVIRQVYGETLALSDLDDDARLDAFIQAASELRPPKIVGGYVTDRQDPTVVTQGFRFMGQRFIPDSYILQQLVYDKVGSMEDPRLFPKGLDVTAALGSEQAYGILLNVYGEGRYANYETQMAKLRQEFAALPADQWTENLYWNWLYTLRPLLEVKGSGYPAFMQNPAWVDKDLHTFLGSWTELRHDTILYAKQSYTLKATSIMPEPKQPLGYVEPQPEVFARLAALTRQMRIGLDDRGLLSDEYRDKLERMESLLLALKTMAEKELRGEALTDEEYATIRSIGSILEALVTFSPQVQEQIESDADARMAIVADVHTDTNTGQVLEEGVGNAFVILAIVPIEGQATVAQGGLFSYYEFTQPMSDRLTDEAWQAREPKPDRPAWTASFIVE
ncbi:MAG: DUF3160 domain-containing protein [Chloroflexota bacterium]